MAPMNRGRFGDVIDGPHGSALCAFVNRPDNVVRMETATALQCVAIEPLGPFLLQEFGEVAYNDRFKRTVGFLARQVLERRGYQITRSNCRISRPGLFKSGTRYADSTRFRTHREDVQPITITPDTDVGSPANEHSGGMDFEKAALARRKLGLDGLTIDFPPDFDDPAFSRRVLGLEE